MWQSKGAELAHTIAADNGEGDFEVVPDKDKTKSYDVDSKSLSVAEVQKGMRADVEHVVSIFGLDVRTHLVILLLLLRINARLYASISKTQHGCC